MTQTGTTYLTAKQVRERFGGIDESTLWRWERDDRLAFPPAMYIHRRRLYRLDEIQAWEASRPKSREAA